MIYPLGCVVRSLSGHDAGNLYVVLGERNGRLLVADGKRREILRPKEKNPRHVRKINRVLEDCENITDRMLRRALAACRETEGGKALVEGRRHRD